MKERVLVVEDDPVMRSICARVLEGLGLEVEAVAGREEAWGALSRHGFELVLTDIYMAAADDGVALAEEVKARSPRTDVILMTGQPSVQSAVAAMQRGAADYLVKPFGPEMLEGVARRCLERRRLSAEVERERGWRRELEAAYSELQKLERLKDALIARVNHELRTPVAVAMLAAEAAAGVPGSEAAAPFHAKLKAALAGLKATIEELLLFTRAVKSELALSLGEVSLAGLLREVRSDLSGKAEERGVALRLDLPGADRRVRADRELLGTALRHLVDNGIRFNKKGGEVIVALDLAGEDAVVTVRDTGIGIPEDQHGRLFDGFYQVADHLTRETGGLGLGLATVRRLVEAHGGRVAVSSRQGQGSVFTVTLPGDAP